MFLANFSTVAECSVLLSESASQLKMQEIVADESTEADFF